MKFSKRALIKLKNKNKKLKRQTFHGRIKGNEERPRLQVHRSHKSLYAQIIDDENSRILVACSTVEHTSRLILQTGKTSNASSLMGKKLAKISLKKNITKIVFDKGAYLYHGRIKALANALRAGGLQF